MGFAKKTVYHGDLVRAGEIYIHVNSGKNVSKFKAANEAGGFWVGFDFDGGQYQYAAECEATADQLAAWDGHNVTIRATGRDYNDANIEILGPTGQQTQQEPPQRPPAQAPRQQPQGRQQNRPQQPRGNQQRPPQQNNRPPQNPPPQRPPAQEPPKPSIIHGQLVGMAIKEANTILNSFQESDAAYFFSPEYSKDLHTLSSDIIRIALYLQEGKLAPKIKDRKEPPAPAPEAPPEPPPAEEPPPEAPPAGEPRRDYGPDDDDIPF